MKNVVETTAPIDITELKKFFENKDTFYLINYEESGLQGVNLLTYMSNLDLPADIGFQTQKGFDDLTTAYLHEEVILTVPILEMRVIELLLQMKGIVELREKDFIDANVDILKLWAKKLDSLTLFNMHSIGQEAFHDYVQSHPIDKTISNTGVNFVSLLKHERFYMFYANVYEEHKIYYESYFNDYMFKGNNLFYYWANENNPMFLLTQGIVSGSLQENPNVPSV